MSIVQTNLPYNSIILRQNLISLSRLFPFLNVQIVGNSVLGTPIYTVKLGIGNKKIFYNGSFHANEYITSILLMKFIEDYCNSYSNNLNLFGISIRELYNSASIYIMPMVNPDGVDLVTGAILPNSIAYASAKKIASSYSSIPFANGWKANINGVDLENLQPVRKAL